MRTKNPRILYAIATDNMYSSVTYIAQQSHVINKLKSYHRYKRLIVLGARYLNLPDAYITTIEGVESTEDPDRTRRKIKEELVERVIKYRKSGAPIGIVLPAAGEICC